MDRRRWTDALPARAAACRLRMPWERGLRRAAFIARRARRGGAAPPLRPAGRGGAIRRIEDVPGLTGGGGPAIPFPSSNPDQLSSVGAGT